jgi:hypothetical protein
MGRRAAAVRLRHAARRPASWLAMVAVAPATLACCGLSETWRPPAAILVGAIGAVAAVGGLMRTVDAASWAAARALWPAAGAGLAGLVDALRSCGGVTSATVIAACATTTAMLAVQARAAAPPATASGAALIAGVIAAGAAAVATLTGVRVAAWPLVALAGWGAAAALLVVRSAARPGAVATAVPPGAVMVSALVAMVACLFLAPEWSWGYAAMAGGWLLVDALPRAALAYGMDGDAARCRLLATATGGQWRRGRAAARLLAASAAVLGWPPLVAAALSGTVASGTRPLAIAAAIAAAAGVLAALVAASLAAGGSRDTALCAALVAALAAFTVGATVRDRGSEPMEPPPGLMLSNPADPATLLGPWEEPRFCQCPRGVVSCPASPVSAFRFRSVPPRCSSW